MNNTIGITLTDSDSKKISSYLWLLFAVCFLGNVLAGMASTLMSVYLPVVVKDLQGSVSGDGLGKMSAYINALYFAGWAMGGLMWGLISDRIGRAVALALAVSMYGLFTFLKSIAPSLELIFVFQFFCGFGVGGVLVVNTTLLSEVWPHATRAVFIGLLSTGFPIGVFSSGVVNFIISDWRQGFMIGAVPFLLGIILFWILKESEKWKETRIHSNKEQVVLSDYKAPLVSGIIIFGSMLIGLWAIFSWLPTWVQSIVTNSDGQRERSLGMMLLGIGGLSGGFASGWVSNVLGMRKTMLICFAGCFIFSFVLFIGNTSFSVFTLIEIALLAFLFGISQGTLSVYIPLLFPVAIRATATGLCFNIGRIFTVVAVFFVGALVTTLGGYGRSLFLFSFVFLIGFIFIIIANRKPSI
ncbi:MAG: MFS transporter [Bacteroidetes bacterium]|nr:MFS transporter [Bacteroidota bacterium]MBS1541078.1 MFS transporter [Bacteroidota bacterium]